MRIYLRISEGSCNKRICFLSKKFNCDRMRTCARSEKKLNALPTLPGRIPDMPAQAAGDTQGTGSQALAGVRAAEPGKSGHKDIFYNIYRNVK